MGFLHVPRLPLVSSPAKFPIRMATSCPKLFIHHSLFLANATISLLRECVGEICDVFPPKTFLLIPFWMFFMNHLALWLKIWHCLGHWTHSAALSIALLAFFCSRNVLFANNAEYVNEKRTLTISKLFQNFNDFSGLYNEKSKNIQTIHTCKKKNIMSPLHFFSPLLRNQLCNRLVHILRRSFVKIHILIILQQCDPLLCNLFHLNNYLGDFQVSIHRFTFSIFDGCRLFHCVAITVYLINTLLVYIGSF